MNDGTVKVKVVCSRGHREKLVPGGRMVYRLEDDVIGPVPEDFAPGDPRRAEEPIVAHAGATAGVAAREFRPDGGTKIRLRCSLPRCPLDVEISWNVLNRGEVASMLREHDGNVLKVELANLAAILSSS